MRVDGRALRQWWSVGICLILALHVSLAQKKVPSGAPDDTRRILIEKARALEARGRPDMAIQSWQQVLLSDPKSVDALAGLAKDYKLIGSTDQSNAALDRLRAVNPNDPNIARIAALNSTRMQSDRLRQAGEMARQGKPEEAMRIYRELYGDRPPDGDIALAYYQTLYGTANGKETAIAAMRALAQRNPGDTRFVVELGVMLTYDAKTRAEGIRILEAHPKEPNAQAALRQALVWDAANPASAAELRKYLESHPQDTELTGRLKENESKLAQMNSGIARTPAERAAFAALNAHKLEEAQARLTAILDEEPNNGRAAAGMGFLRMQQNNFGGAISYLTQAEQNGYKDPAVSAALVTSRFWYTMGEASQAFDENQMEVAAAKYKAALAMRPRSVEALNGMAGLLVKEQQFTAAAAMYEDLIKVQPGSVAAWRGLFLAYARDGQNQKALALAGRFPPAVKSATARDPEYLRTLATLYHAENRSSDAQHVLAQALSLPFPDNGTSLKADTRLQYAGILMEARRFDQAVELYTQILNEDAGNLAAWMGLVSAHHELTQDNLAIADVEKMPPATYDAALADAGFLSMLGSIYQQANQFDIAQGLLERSAKMQMTAGGQPSIPLQLQLAAIYLERNNTAQAYAIYREVLEKNPDRVDAWKGLISTLQATSRTTEALQQLALIPAPVRKQLESDIEFVQGEASLYAAGGDTAHAIEYMNRVQAHYRELKTQPPPAIEIQNAWLLFNTGNDRILYPALMRLGARQDLTNPQREAVQSIWANWSVRRAGAAMDNDNIQRAVDILDAASQAFPDNLAVRKAVAGGYVKVGRAKESLALFKTIPMQDATAGDFQGAIGAALSANDKAQAELWLRQALDRYPRNPAILSLAARFEQARGDNQRAADYWRASLAAMPQATPADRLAHELAYPEQDAKARRAVTAADLQHLLDPNYEPFQKTTKLPPLPAYGPDPYNGRAPIDLNQPQPTPQKQYSPSPADGSLPNPQASNGADPASVQALSPSLDPVSAPFARKAGKKANLAAPSSFMGAMHLPPSQGHIASPRIPAAQLSSLQAEIGPASPGLNPPTHSLAGDAWKGLLFSLMAGNRIDEAFRQMAQIPPDVRRQLDGDVEFIQAQAGLYAASGDVPHAEESLGRVEAYYTLRHAAPPAALEVQHAWLLYNARDDKKLYPVLRALDARRDLTAAQRDEAQTIWGDWSLRRAVSAMDEGNAQGAVEILEAAARDYPNNAAIRRALAGGYLQAGRVSESLSIFKSIPMEGASASEYQSATGAALAAGDMVQTEAWLREALGRYPSDSGILSVAARFEQARGNNQRASDFWRASLAAMPAGSTAHRFDTLRAVPAAQAAEARRPAPGDLKLLLDPGLQPSQGATKPFILPGSGSASLGGAGLPRLREPDPTARSGAQSGVVSNAPLYIPQRDASGRQIGQSVLTEQIAHQTAVMVSVVWGTQDGKPARPTAQARDAAQAPSYTGTVKLPPSKRTSTPPRPAHRACRRQSRLRLRLPFRLRRRAVPPTRALDCASPRSPWMSWRRARWRSLPSRWTVS